MTMELLRWSKHGLVQRLAPCVLMALVALPLTELAAQPAQSEPAAASEDKIANLRREVGSLWNQAVELGGEIPTHSIRRVEGRIVELTDLYRRLDEVAEIHAESVEELAKLRKQMADTSILTLEDAAGIATSEAGEAVARRSVGAATGRALGWIGWVGTVAEIGGKRVIKDLNVDRMTEMLKDERIKLSDVIKLQRALLHDLKSERDKLQRLTELVERYHTAYDKLARARAVAGPACRHAVLARETDAEGDAEERREDLRTRTRITLSRPYPPRRTGVWKGVSKGQAKDRQPGESLYPKSRDEGPSDSLQLVESRLREMSTLIRKRDADCDHARKAVAESCRSRGRQLETMFAYSSVNNILFCHIGLLEALQQSSAEETIRLRDEACAIKAVLDDLEHEIRKYVSQYNAVHHQTLHRFQGLCDPG